jgi:hypothetical protein
MNNTTVILTIIKASTCELFITSELTSVADQGFVGPAAYTILGALFKVKQN